MSEEYFGIIYPEQRCIPQSKIESWYNDCLANGDIAPESEGEHPISLHEKMSRLEDTGEVTFDPTAYDAADTF